MERGGIARQEGQARRRTRTGTRTRMKREETNLEHRERQSWLRYHAVRRHSNSSLLLSLLSDGLALSASMDGSLKMKCFLRRHRRAENVRSERQQATTDLCALDQTVGSSANETRTRDSAGLRVVTGDSGGERDCRREASKRTTRRR
jgi:hypothetical protein